MPAAAPPLEPLSRRLLQAAGVLSLLLILVVVNSLLNSGSDSPFNPNPVAAAAERTQAVPGMRMNMTMRVSSESTPPVTVVGKGVYNGADNLAEITYDGTTAQGQRMRFDAILGEDAWYFRYPQLAGQMPEGKEWIKLEGFPGQEDMSAPTAGGPDESLRMLQVAGDVHRVGPARIGGAQTTRYRLTMSPEGLVRGLQAQGKDELAEQIEQAAPQMVGPVHAEVFITDAGMLRRMRTVSTELSDGKAVTTEVRADLFDFGIAPEIAVPDDSRVYELGPEVEEQLEALGQSS
ncbi:MAG TPA: hypothetical protein VFJ61_01145 [Solirubrobacterales bacterium]|nr:hypothetical protein [Solirubrobacterales bacterium]